MRWQSLVNFDPATRVLSVSRWQLMAGMLIAMLITAVLSAFVSIAIKYDVAWVVLLPPLMTIMLAMISKRVVLSLFFGILFAGFLNQSDHFSASTSTPVDLMWAFSAEHGLQPWATTLQWYRDAIISEFNLFLLTFVISMMMMVNITTGTHGFDGLVNRLQKSATTARSVKLTTSAMGGLIFFDDYANTTVVGSAMRPLADRYQISREKLAFIVDSTAAPIAGLALISTWVGYEAGLFEPLLQAAAIDLNGFSLIFESLAFRFYCIFLLLFVLINSLLDRDFGPMSKSKPMMQAADANQASAVNEINKLPSTANKHHPSIARALMPIAILILTIIIGLFIDGNISTSPWSFSTWQNILINASHTVQIFALAGMLSLFCAIALVPKSYRANIPSLAIAALRLSLIPIAILISAWAFKAALDALQCAQYLIPIVQNNLNPLFFPIIVFLVAAMISFATGTSWGTMATVIPIAFPLAIALNPGINPGEATILGPVFLLTIAATLDGSIFGDHCSPLSDTTILSSTACQCDHIAHVKTQFPYAVCVAILALLLGYLPVILHDAGFWLYLAAIVAIVAVHFIFGRQNQLEQTAAQPHR